MARYAQSIDFILAQVRTLSGPVVGGQAFFYAAGTTTPKTIWLDRGKTTEAANPYTLGANATAQLFGDGLYRVVLTYPPTIIPGQDPIPGATIPGGDIDNIAFKDASGLAYDVADYASLAAACAALNGTGATLQYSTDQTLAANLTTDVELVPVNGAVINHGAYTITYSGTPARWPLAKIFNGTGAISGPKHVYPEWFGAVAEDALVSISKAIAVVANGGAVELTAGNYPISAVIDFPETSTKVKLFSKTGSAITVAGTHDCIDLTAQNENYGGHTLEGLTLTGPNNYYAGQMTISQGSGVRMQRAAGDTTNVNTAYNTVIRDCVIQGFKQGLRLRSAIKVHVEGKTFLRFNRYGVLFDGGAANANNFNGVTISMNDLAGVQSAGTTGGTLTDASSNVFSGCLLESNHAYGATGGIAIYLNRSYDFVFDGCYTEDHQYSVYLTNGASGNKFINQRTNKGPAGLDGILISGALCFGNIFQGCKAAGSTITDSNVEIDSADSLYNQFLDCEGFNFNPAVVLRMPYIRNMRPNAASQGGVGIISMPPHGFVDNVIEGVGAAQLEGIGTATATLHCRGMGELTLGAVVAAAGSNTTITTLEGLTPHSILVLWNYQTTRTVTIKHTSGTGNIVLKPTLSPTISVNDVTHTGTLAYTADAVMSQYGQMIVFYVTAYGRAYEIGRNF